MRIREFTAPTMQDALKLIKTELGKDAVILSTRKVKGMHGEPTLHITAAVEASEAPPAPAASFSAQPVSAALPVAPNLKETLAAHGVQSDTINRILKAAEALGETGFSAADTLEMVLGKSIQFTVPATALKKGQAHVFVGPTGAGKTTTIAKLALQLKKQGHSVGLVSLDHQKIGGFEPLDIIADVLADQAHLVRGKDDLKAAAQSLGKRNFILIDTPGMGAYDKPRIAALKKQLEALGLATTTHLVLPATHNMQELPAYPMAFAPLNPQHIIFTKMDETALWGNIVNTSTAGGLQVCHVADSPEIDSPFLNLDAKLLAAQLATPPTYLWEN